MNSTSFVSQMRMRQWAAIIHECKNSGISTTQWLKEHGIDYHSYYYWHKKLQDVCVDELLQSENQTTAFAELPIPVGAMRASANQDTVSDMTAAVLYINDIKIEIRDSASAEFLNRLLEVSVHAK